jgi:hypothetical protein
MSFIVALPLLFLTVNPLPLLLYIPLLTRVFYRAGKAYFYTRQMILSLLLPFLDLLQGLCYFIGLLKAIILVVLKRYTPAK